jgi:hypothetical protein
MLDRHHGDLFHRSRGSDESGRGNSVTKVNRACCCMYVSFAVCIIAQVVEYSTEPGVVILMASVPRRALLACTPSSHSNVTSVMLPPQRELQSTHGFQERELCRPLRSGHAMRGPLLRCISSSSLFTCVRVPDGRCSGALMNKSCCFITACRCPPDDRHAGRRSRMGESFASHISSHTHTHTHTHKGDSGRRAFISMDPAAAPSKSKWLVTRA